MKLATHCSLLLPQRFRRKDVYYGVGLSGLLVVKATATATAELHRIQSAIEG